MSPGPADQNLCAMPPSASEIKRIGQKVLRQLPDLFRRYVRDVVIRVQDFADDATLAEMGIESPFDLLGLYHGVPVGRGSEMAPPRSDVDIIFLYRRALLDYWCETGEPLEDIVRNTLIHEIGHHFGFSDEDMDEIEFGDR
jgi:predicted Zn-dependent protease with MMP-like domain